MSIQGSCCWSSLIRLILTHLECMGPASGWAVQPRTLSASFFLLVQVLHALLPRALFLRSVILYTARVLLLARTLPMELECWEASFESNLENGSTSESSISRILCDSSNPMMMIWQADKNGSVFTPWWINTNGSETVCVCVVRCMTVDFN